MSRYRTQGTTRARRGLTLIELIVVLVILAAIAGLVMPAVAMLGRSTDMAVSADSQNALANNIQQYFVLQKRYPQGMDSLLQPNATGVTVPANTAPTGIYTRVVDATGQQVSGLTNSSPNMLALLEMFSLTNGTTSGDGVGDWNRSFTRGGFDYVFDHHSYDPSGPAGERNANNSGKFRRDLTGSSIPVARINPAAVGVNNQVVKGLVPNDFDANGVYTPETDTQLVVLGIGPSCKLVPTTMLNTPLYPGADGSYYGRYFAVFKVFGSGERCVLVGVTDAYGRTPDYTQQQFNESLPNNARQG